MCCRPGAARAAGRARRIYLLGRRTGGLFREAAPSSRGHDTLQPKVHEQLRAVRQLVLFDELQHLHAGEALEIEMTGGHLGEELGRLRRQLLAALGHRLAHGGGDLRGTGILGQGPEVGLCAVAELLTGGFLASEQHAGKPVSGIEDVAGDLAETIDIGCRAIVEVGAFFHGQGRVFADGFPGIEELIESDHFSIVRQKKAEL